MPHGNNFLMRCFIKILLTATLSISFNSYLLGQQYQTRCIMGYSSSSFQDIDPVDATAAIAVYVENARGMLQKRLKKSVDFHYKVFNSLEEMKQALKEGSVDLISLSATEYYELKKSYKLSPYLAIRVTDNMYDQYCMITHEKSGINNVKDLVNKTLSIPSPKYHVLMEEWLNVMLDENKLKEPQTTFNKIKNAGKESNAVYDVFFRQSDCAIVRKSVFNTLCDLNPQLSKNIKAVISSDPIVLIFSVANENSDQELIKVYLEQAMMTTNSMNVRNILKIFKAQDFLKLREENLQSAKEIVDKYNSLKIKKKVKNNPNPK